MAEPEFSRPFSIDRLGPDGASVAFAASESERARLAERFGLVALDRLDGEVRLVRAPGGDPIRVRGHFSADVVQLCVVTLEPFSSLVEDEIEADFTERAVAAPAEIALELEEEPPEPVVDGSIDVGELAAQFLSLALEPYPRAPGAMLAEVWSAEDTAVEHPFAALERLRKPK